MFPKKTYICITKCDIFQMRDDMRANKLTTSKMQSEVVVARKRTMGSEATAWAATGTKLYYIHTVLCHDDM